MLETATSSFATLLLRSTPGKHTTPSFTRRSNPHPQAEHQALLHGHVRTLITRRALAARAPRALPARAPASTCLFAS